MRVKVVPRAARTELAGWVGDALKVRVAAPPEDGRANAAVLATLAAALGVPVARVRLVAGAAAAHKIVAVDALAADELHARLRKAMEAGKRHGAK